MNHEPIKKLREKWMKYRSIPFPKPPPFESDLNAPICELIEQDAWVAGCISRIVEDGALDDDLHALLVIDPGLTERIANTSDPKRDEFLEYKSRLDHLIRLALQVLELDDD